MGMLKDKLIKNIESFSEDIVEKCKEANGLYSESYIEMRLAVWRRDGGGKVMEFNSGHHFEHWLKNTGHRMGEFEVREKPVRYRFVWDDFSLTQKTATELMNLYEALQKVK